MKWCGTSTRIALSNVSYTVKMFCSHIHIKILQRISQTFTYCISLRIWYDQDRPSLQTFIGDCTVSGNLLQLQLPLQFFSFFVLKSYWDAFLWAFFSIVSREIISNLHMLLTLQSALEQYQEKYCLITKK